MFLLNPDAIKYIKEIRTIIKADSFDNVDEKMYLIDMRLDWLRDIKVRDENIDIPSADLFKYIRETIEQKILSEEKEKIVNAGIAGIEAG